MGKQPTEMQRVVLLSELLVRKQEEVKEAETELKKLKKEMLRLEREDLPQLFAELGLSEITLEDGSKIKVTEDADASITEANRPLALQWLLDNGFGGLIKTEVSLEFARGQHDEAVAARDSLAKKYDGVQLRENVHHSTLRSFVKEQLAAGAPIPFDLFSIQPYSKATIKKR